ncbi:MAG TPA: VOC family protein [Mycobacteriales bacterium]|nr:VOC family protein [Mycobacteriales bacterium]
MTNPVAWFEIEGKDGTALQNFYSGLFGWNVDADNPMNYGMVEAAQSGIGGGIGSSQDGSSRLTFYVQVADLQASLDRAVELGGAVIMPPMDVPDGPTIAMFSDIAGNQVGLMTRM